MENLVVIVLGSQNSGKTHTWNTLFGGTVRTGKYSRTLAVSPTEEVEVFLVNGSPEERGKNVGEIITAPNPRIVLCSVQYLEDARNTFEYFVTRDYLPYVQWLNPGRGDAAQMPDTLGLVPHLLFQGAILSVRDGQVQADERVEEIRTYVRAWAEARNLLRRIEHVVT